MNLEEIRNALGQWFSARFFKESGTNKDEWETLEHYVVGYIECGGLDDNEFIKMAIERFKTVQAQLAIDIDTYYIVADYLNGHGVTDREMHIPEALEFNKTLTVEQIRIMIARRFGMLVASRYCNFMDKLDYLKGYVDCGCTIEDLAKSEVLTDREIAKGLFDFINKLPTDAKLSTLNKLQSNAVNRAIREKLSNGGNTK